MNKHPLDLALAAAIQGQPDISESILRNYEEQDDARVIFNLAWHEMRHGNLKKGMQMMDAGRFINCFGLPRIPGEIWRDQDLTNKTLLFRCENGIGDQIMNFRFAKYFQDLGARVVISCIPQLMPIFSRHGFVCIDNGATPYIHYDYWIPAMSAAHILGFDTDTFPGQPYMTAEPRKLFAKPGTLKVGIRWAGNPEFEHEQFRRFEPQPLIDLYELPGVTLYSLQRDENLIDGLPFADLREQMPTWDDTASIIQGLDLVITSCTSIAHMAGALGKEVWVIVPMLPYYAWAQPKETSVWYDSVRLFRQVKFGEWDGPLSKVRQALEHRLLSTKTNVGDTDVHQSNQRGDRDIPILNRSTSERQPKHVVPQKSVARNSGAVASIPSYAYNDTGCYTTADCT